MATKANNTKWLLISISVIIIAAVILLFTGGKQLVLLNVSYDPTRELYAEINPLFAKEWQQKTGQMVTIRQSHGGSGKQARSVIDGLPADIVTLALGYDIDEIASQTAKIPADWQGRLPHNSTPFTSTIVFLVRKGNPKAIKDWNDLIRPGISVITPNPKTSGGARWNYLAAWAYANKAFDGDEEKITDFMRKLYFNVPVLDTGARGSTTTFTQRKMGDVLIAWENEALLATHQLSPDEFEIVYPSLSILAEAPVTLVEQNAKAHGTFEIALAYLQFLYSSEAQKIAAKHYFRPTNEEALQQSADIFPVIDMVTIQSDFGGWEVAQNKHFKDGGVFDHIYEKK